MRFGKLTVVERIRLSDKKGVFWKCICDCGNEKIVKSALLSENKVRSCGCLKNIPKHDDITGIKFNMILVKKYAGKYPDGRSKWLCICDCGEETYASAKDLKSGSKKSCGCLKFNFPKDISNLVFGKLKVLSISDKKIKKGSLWNCICECGNEIEVTRDSLTTGNTRSCGCLYGRSSFIDRSGERFGRLLIDGYVGRTKDNKILWRCICDCGNIIYTNTNALVLNKTVSCGCYKRQQTSIRFKNAIRPKGADSPHWNPNLTQEERMLHRAYKEYNDWRFLVYERDGFKCFICGGGEGKINAHHIFSHNKYKNLRLCVPNGITLCESCHVNFHNIYKRGNNDIQQFANFLYNLALLEKDLPINDRINICMNLINSSEINKISKIVNNEFEIIHNIISDIKILTMGGGKKNE